MAEMSRTLIEDGLAWRYTPSRMATLIHDREHVALVACDAHGPQGLAVMQFGELHAHLVLLCVQPALQRQGLGRRLLQWLIESAQVAGIVSVRLELRADNLGAQAFYQRLGFVETRLVPGYYDGEISARRMALPVRTAAFRGA